MQVIVEVVKGPGDKDDVGAAVIDDFTHFDDMADCSVLPTEATPPHQPR